MHFYYEKPDLVARNWDGGLNQPPEAEAHGELKI